MKKQAYYFIQILLFTVAFSSIAKGQTTISGKVTDQNNKALEFVNVVVASTNEGTVTSPTGDFKIKTNAEFPVTLIATFIGYNKSTITIKSADNATNISFKLKQKAEELDQVEVQGRLKGQSFTKINAKTTMLLPDVSGGNIEGLVKSQIGVSSNNELSSQYRVRGGNYDENMVYVNDIEIYRPFLIRSGQQEGLSFVNPDLVSSLKFSPGGFESQYGDKMSSVLDVTYKDPKEFKGSAKASFLGASTHLEGSSKNEKFSIITGARYKTNQYLLGSLDTEGDYNPTFFDVQAFMTYKFNKKWKLNALGYFSNNTYNFTPTTRQTTFGTLGDTKNLVIYFEGQEKDQFSTAMGAASLSYIHNYSNRFKVTVSSYQTFEEENFDILGEYRLEEITPDFSGKSSSSKGQNIGVGSNMEHARNSLYGTISNLALQGKHHISNNRLSWEIKGQKEFFKDYFNEWEMRDSSGYSLPYSDNQVDLVYAYNSQQETNTNRLTTYIQDELPIETNLGELILNFGFRTNYWDYNNEFLISPRANILLHPNNNKKVRLRMAGGIYYQSPLYRELRTPEGILNPDIKAQKSTQIVAGYDKYFTWNNRPFKFTTEAYYKKFDNLIPYQIDNVRVRYLGENNAKGYATGIDFKIHGDFVPGVESWFNMSIMKSEEDITDDSYIVTHKNGETETTETIYPGYIPRPTDQRVTFSLFFQDYLPNNPTLRVNLNLLYGTGLPFGPPQSDRYMAVNRMPDYRRVDLGLMKDLRGKNPKPNGLLDEFWLSLEVFNLFDIQNTISYFWVSDVNNQQYAVPNYLTSRRINLKLTVAF